MAYTGATEIEEQDTNPNSPTFGQVRWVPGGSNTTLCPVPNTAATWERTVYNQCEKTSDGKNTGYLEVQEFDSNPNSATYLETRFVRDVYNVSQCPISQPAFMTGVRVSSGFLVLQDACAAEVYDYQMVYTPSGALSAGQVPYWDSQGAVRLSNGYYKQSGSGLILYVSSGKITNPEITCSGSGGGGGGFGRPDSEV